MESLFRDFTSKNRSQMRLWLYFRSFIRLDTQRNFVKVRPPTKKLRNLLERILYIYKQARVQMKRSEHYVNLPLNKYYT